MTPDWYGFIITVDNSAATPIYNLLPGANYWQIYIPDTGTPQVLIVTKPKHGTVRVPALSDFEVPARNDFLPNEELCSVQTAQGSTALQVILQRRRD